MTFTLTEPTYPTAVDAVGFIDVSFGGVLNIGASQPTGSYTTPTDFYRIQVDYN